MPTRQWAGWVESKFRGIQPVPDGNGRLGGGTV